MARFLDTNIVLRYFVASDEDKARRSQALLERVERGGEKLVTSLMVVAEVVFTLQHSYRVPKGQIREMLEDVLSLRSLQLGSKNRCLDALALYVEKNISFVDAYNAVFMASQGIEEIYSWDGDFDKLPGVTRIEP